MSESVTDSRRFPAIMRGKRHSLHPTCLIPLNNNTVYLQWPAPFVVVSPWTNCLGIKIIGNTVLCYSLSKYVAHTELNEMVENSNLTLGIYWALFYKIKPLCGFSGDLVVFWASQNCVRLAMCSFSSGNGGRCGKAASNDAAETGSEAKEARRTTIRRRHGCLHCDNGGETVCAHPREDNAEEGRTKRHCKCGMTFKTGKFSDELVVFSTFYLTKQNQIHTRSSFKNAKMANTKPSK